MKILEIISDTKKKKESLKKRESVRGIIFLGNKIPLIMQSLWAGYKLPGGGVKNGESQKETLEREFLEETGISVTDSCYIGSIEEVQEEGVYELSHCYLGAGKRDSNFHIPEFDGVEQMLDSEIIYVNLNSAIHLLASSRPTVPRGHFIIKRDLRFLKEAENVLKEKVYDSKV
ncbi:MAG: NUDIX domain-containing protein [Candidatus Pacebacteria bacterium]|nr:NUDIX domain-containing protein [Candidatus Paceibacterota bacterium]